MKELIIKCNLSIKKTLLKMKESNSKSLVVEEDGFLKGTISDGDIRNALLFGEKINSKINKIYNKNCTFFYEKDQDLKKIKSVMLNNRFDLIPITDKQKKIINIYTFRNLFGEVRSKVSLKKIAVVIMAGGLGKRMRPITSIIPKPLLPIEGKPLIEIIIEKFRYYKIDKFFISTNYKGSLIKAFFNDLKPKYNVEYIDENQPLGTVGSLGFLKKKLKSDFFVINCDTIIDIDFSDAYKFHKSKKFDLTVIASKKDYKIPYGTCIVDDYGSLKEIKEKPSIDFLANTGLYIFTPKILRFISENKKLDFDVLLKALLKKNVSVGVYPINDDFWVDVGSLKDYKKISN